MAPKKGKNQAKSSNIKIKSKNNQQKRLMKSVKSRKLEEKPLDNLKWFSKPQQTSKFSRMEAGLTWIDDNTYKKDFASSTSSGADSSGYADCNAQEFKSHFSEQSDESDCHCITDKVPETKLGILKRNSSSPNSAVAKYIQFGMDHVASFIVESAIRFGEQHGVVIPDKNIPNVYQITPPTHRRFLDDKLRRIRFKIPRKGIECGNSKKLLPRSQTRIPSDTVRNARKLHRRYGESSQSEDDCLRKIIPLLKKFKKSGAPRSEMNFRKEEGSSERENASVPPSSVRERTRLREKEKRREKERERSRLTEIDSEREVRREKDMKRNRERKKEKDRLKKMLVTGRIKSAGAESESKAETVEYPRRPWNKFRQDSLELGRQRLRTSTCLRKFDKLSEASNF